MMNDLCSRWTHNDLQVAVVGPKIDLTYTYEHLGDSVNILNELTSGKHAFAKVEQYNDE
jgi:hypothetical protein